MGPGAALPSLQYESILQTLSYFSNFSKLDKFRRYRPMTTRPTDDPRGWWTYAINSVMHISRLPWVLPLGHGRPRLVVLCQSEALGEGVSFLMRLV